MIDMAPKGTETIELWRHLMLSLLSVKVQSCEVSALVYSLLFSLSIALLGKTLCS